MYRIFVAMPVLPRLKSAPGQNTKLLLPRYLQNLMAQRDNYLEHSGQEWFNIQAIRDAFQALKSNVDTILNVTQRIEYIEETLPDMQGSIEEMKKQQNKASQ